jgi:hypothetical protein
MMAANWLTIKRRGSDRIEYSVSLAYRIIFGAISVLLLAALASAAQRLFDRSNTVAYVLLLASVVAALYEERWLFSRDGLEYRVGIVGLARHRRWAVAQARCLRLVEGKQSMGRPFVSLSLTLAQGKPYRIDMARGAAGDRLREMAQDVSRLCDIPVET